MDEQQQTPEMQQTQQAPKTPEYKSFKVARGHYGMWWMYEWRATLGFFAVGIFGTAAAAIAYFLVNLHPLFSIAIGVVVAISAGFVYNFLAGKNGWQKLNWLDILGYGFPDVP